MQINTKVQIIMDQNDIEAAILAALYDKMPHLKGTELTIKLIGGRGDAGHRAEIEGVQEASEPVTTDAETTPATSTKPKAVREQEAAPEKEDEDTPPFKEEEEAVAVEAEPKQEPRGIFRRNGKEEVTDKAAPETGDDKEAPKSKGLFSNLSRPDNRS